jgi:hypothetical protein
VAWKRGHAANPLEQRLPRLTAKPVVRVIAVKGGNAEYGITRYAVNPTEPSPVMNLNLALGVSGNGKGLVSSFGEDDRVCGLVNDNAWRGVLAQVPIDGADDVT